MCSLQVSAIPGADGQVVVLFVNRYDALPTRMNTLCSVSYVGAIKHLVVLVHAGVYEVLWILWLLLQYLDGLPRLPRVMQLLCT